MALSDGNKREYTAEELAVLAGVIDYADRMLYEDKHLNVLGGHGGELWLCRHVTSTCVPIAAQERVFEDGRH